MYTFYKDAQLSPSLLKELEELNIEINPYAILLVWGMKDGNITDFVVVPKTTVNHATVSKFVDFKPSGSMFSLSTFIEEDGEVYHINYDMVEEAPQDLFETLDTCIKACIFTDSKYDEIYHEMSTSIFRALSYSMKDYGSEYGKYDSHLVEEEQEIIPYENEDGEETNYLTIKKFNHA